MSKSGGTPATQAHTDAKHSDGPNSKPGHAHVTGDVTGLGTAATKDTGTAAGNVILGNDARLTDTRTPTDGSVTNAKVAVGAAIATAKLADAALITGAEQAANKGVANGYAGLDVGGRVSQQPAVHKVRGGGHSDSWRRTGALAETFSRRAHRFDNGTGFTSGKESLFAITLPAGTYSSITLLSATTPGSAMTHQWFGLRDTAFAKIAGGFTADDGATAWAASTEKTLMISREVTDAAITSGQATLTSATAAFTAADVGKQVTVMGAGAAGVPLGTSAAPVTIASVTNGTTAVLSANAGTTVSGATAYVATPLVLANDTDAYVVAMVAGTVPTLAAITGSFPTQQFGSTPVIAGRFDGNSGLTDPASAPGTATTFNQASFTYAYAYAS